MCRSTVRCKRYGVLPQDSSANFTESGFDLILHFTFDMSQIILIILRTKFVSDTP